MLNLEKDGELPNSWWKQARKEIEDAKKAFIKSGKIGGNPLGIPNDMLKKKVKE